MEGKLCHLYIRQRLNVQTTQATKKVEQNKQQK